MQSPNADRYSIWSEAIVSVTYNASHLAGRAQASLPPLPVPVTQSSSAEHLQLYPDVLFYTGAPPAPLASAWPYRAALL